MNELVTLFFISFLSSTLLPGGSEAHLSWLVINSTYPLFYLLLIASIGNTLGGFSNWLLGYFINHSLVRKFKQKKTIRNKRYLIARSWIKKWGVYTLLFSWLPLIGDLLCLLAGIYKLKWLNCLIAILIGKSIRYALLIYVINEIRI
ncbi:MAG: YqaA family protein [Pseudomonadota bacterium]